MRACSTTRECQADEFLAWLVRLNSLQLTTRRSNCMRLCCGDMPRPSTDAATSRTCITLEGFFQILLIGSEDTALPAAVPTDGPEEQEGSSEEEPSSSSLSRFPLSLSRDVANAWWAVQAPMQSRWGSAPFGVARADSAFPHLGHASQLLRDVVFL